MTTTPRFTLAAACAFALAAVLLLFGIAGPAQAASGSTITLAEWSKSVPLPTSSGSFASGGSSGDGYDVFFDNANHVFNIWHHDGNGTGSADGAVDCHTVTGGSCGPGWPFKVSPYHTDMLATGYVDNAAKKLWFPTNTDSNVGFACLDLSNFATGPTWCGGSETAALTSLGSSSSTTYGDVSGLAVLGTKLYTLKASGELLCLDIGAAPPGACGGFPKVTTATTNDSVVLVAGKDVIFGVSGKTGSGRAFCVTAAGGNCTVSPAPPTTGGATMYSQPDASGVVEAVCIQEFKTGTPAVNCYKPDGSATATSNSGLAAAIPVTTGAFFFPPPVTTGTRVYYGNGVISGAGEIGCYDVATSASCAGAWPVKDASAYALSIDPNTPTCLWKNDHPGVITSYKADGTIGCYSASSAATEIVFSPTLPCTSGTISTWSSFTLSAPAVGTYSSATLTVKNAAGTVVKSSGKTWSAVPITGAKRTVALTKLLVKDTGTAPTFTVSLAGSTATGDATAALVMGVKNAVGCTKTVTATSPIAITTTVNPKRPRAGRPTTVTVRARNRGTTTAKGTKIIARVPRGFRLVSAPGATVKGRVVTWTIGSLKAKATASRSMTLVPLQRGRAVLGLSVTSSTVDTAVKAVPLLVLPGAFPVTG